MSDLIDLDTSATLAPSKLPDPLIPSPQGIDISRQPSLSDDNPFDQVFHQVNHFMRRSMDPFEILSRNDEYPKNNEHSADEAELSILNVSQLNDTFFENAQEMAPNLNLNLNDVDKLAGNVHFSNINVAKVAENSNLNISKKFASNLTLNDNPSEKMARSFSLNLNNHFSSFCDDRSLNCEHRIGRSKSDLDCRFLNPFGEGKTRGNSSLISGNFSQVPSNRYIGDISVEANKLVNALSSLNQNILEDDINLLEAETFPDLTLLSSFEDENNKEENIFDQEKLKNSIFKTPNEKNDNIPEIIEPMSEENFVQNVKTDSRSKIEGFNEIAKFINILPETAKMLENYLLDKNQKKEKKNECKDIHKKVDKNCEKVDFIENDLNQLNNLSTEKTINKSDKKINLQDEKKTSADKSEEKTSDIKTLILSLQKTVTDSSAIDAQTRQQFLEYLKTILVKMSGYSSENQNSNSPTSNAVSTKRKESKGLVESVKLGSRIRSKSLSSPRRSSLDKKSISTSVKSKLNSSHELLALTTEVKCKMQNPAKSDRKKADKIPELPIPKTNIKSKLKRKIEANVIKGPLKAVVPLSNMRKISPLKKGSKLSPVKSIKNLSNTSSNNPMATSTPVTRRSMSQIKPRKLENIGKSLHFKEDSENRSRLQYDFCGLRNSSMKHSNVEKDNVPVYMNGLTKKFANSNITGIHKPMLMSPLRTNNQNIPIRRSALMPKVRSFNIKQVIEKENQYL